MQFPVFFRRKWVTHCVWFLGASCQPKDHKLPSKEEAWQGFQAGLQVPKACVGLPSRAALRLVTKLPHVFLTSCEFSITLAPLSVSSRWTLVFTLFVGFLLWYAAKNMPEKGLPPSTLAPVLSWDTESKVEKSYLLQPWFPHYTSHTSYIIHQRIKDWALWDLAFPTPLTS